MQKFWLDDCQNLRDEERRAENDLVVINMKLWKNGIPITCKPKKNLLWGTKFLNWFRISWIYGSDLGNLGNNGQWAAENASLKFFLEPERSLGGDVDLGPSVWKWWVKLGSEYDPWGKIQRMELGNQRRLEGSWLLSSLKHNRNTVCELFM